jgi:putative ABC transport system permease protein
MFATQGLRLVATGLIFGLASVWGLTQFVQALLYGVTAMDPSNLIMTALALLCPAGLATLIPARRAAGVDPTAALRDE